MVFCIRLENNLLYVHFDQFTLTFKNSYLQLTQSCTKLTGTRTQPRLPQPSLSPIPCLEILILCLLTFYKVF